MYNPREIYRAYRNKITNKVWGMARMPARGKKKGAVLISYITEPFTLAPWEKFSNFHTMYWECREIARLFAEKGYASDIVSAENLSFIPRKPYAFCIDVEDALERLSKHLPAGCKKIFRILNPYWKTYMPPSRPVLTGSRSGAVRACCRTVPVGRRATRSWRIILRDLATRLCSIHFANSTSPYSSCRSRP